MTSPRGALAPAGFLWGRDSSDRWHVLPTTALTDADGAYRRLVQAVCGEWASVSPHQPGHWAEITRWLSPQYGLCGRCMEAEPAAEAALCAAAWGPPAEQGRLF